MPKGTKVEEVYSALRRDGHSEESAARIAQSQTGEALATGKHPKAKDGGAPVFNPREFPDTNDGQNTGSYDTGRAADDEWVVADKDVYDPPPEWDVMDADVRGDGRNKGSCKPGQNAARDGCTPAAKPSGGSKPSAGAKPNKPKPKPGATKPSGQAKPTAGKPSAKPKPLAKPGKPSQAPLTLSQHVAAATQAIKGGIAKLSAKASAVRSQASAAVGKVFRSAKRAVQDAGGLAKDEWNHVNDTFDSWNEKLNNKYGEDGAVNVLAYALTAADVGGGHLINSLGAGGKLLGGMLMKMASSFKNRGKKSDDDTDWREASQEALDDLLNELVGDPEEEQVEESWDVLPPTREDQPGMRQKALNLAQAWQKAKQLIAEMDKDSGHTDCAILDGPNKDAEYVSVYCRHFDPAFVHAMAQKHGGEVSSSGQELEISWEYGGVKSKALIAVDLHGTIGSPLTENWATEYDPSEYFVQEGAIDALQSLKDEGHDICVWTCWDTDSAREWLDENGVPYDLINEEGPNHGSPKVDTDAYIDDKAIPHDGNWAATLQAVKNHLEFDEEDPFPLAKSVRIRKRVNSTGVCWKTCWKSCDCNECVSKAPCKQGQSAEATGCTPKQKPAGKEDDGKKPTGGKQKPRGSKEGELSERPEPKQPVKITSQPQAPPPQGEMNAKAERAKASHKMVDKTIQRYAEEYNEPRFAKVVGGQSHPDSEPMDVTAGNGDLVEMKTMVDNKNDKITMDSYAQVRKIVKEKEVGKQFHTVISDDSKVFNALGDGQHDESQRQYFYRRGVAGSARIGAMHKCESEEELKKLMLMSEDELPAAAKRTDSALREGDWESFKDDQGKGFKDKKSGRIVRAKK